MEFLDKIRTFIQELDEKEFRTYLIAVLSGIFIVLIFFVAFYLKRVSTLKKQISYVNEKREEVKNILEKNEVVDQQKQKVDTLLENKDFKIRQYFEDVVKKLSLEKPLIATSQIDKDATYREVILKATLDDLNMKQVCDLLEEIEKKKSLVYTKELEITRSKKRPRAIDVALTIATLQKKSQQSELAE